MAKPIHKQITSILGFILFGILIASFAFFGAGSLVTQQGAVVATVGDQQVTANDFATAFENEVARYREQFGPEFDTQRALDMGLDQVVVNQLVQRATLDQQAEDLGLLGSSEEVRSVIGEMEAFKDLNGEFSEFAYKQRLLAGRRDVEEFETLVRHDIARTQLIEGFTDTALLPETLVNTLYTYRKESRRARVATIPASVVSSKEEPSPEALKAYYDANPNMFAAPEYRNLSFMIVSPGQFAENIEISEEDLHAEYDLRFEEFNTPETRTLDVAVLRSEDQARQLYQRAAAGEDFVAVAAELTGFTAAELSLGEKTQFEINDDYGNVAGERVFAAPLDGVTEPTQSLLSWQVFHVAAINPGVGKSFEEVREELLQVLAADRGIDRLYNAVAVIDNDILSGFDLEQIAAGAEIPLVNIDAVSAQGQDKGGALIKETEIFPYLARAFQMREDDPLQLFDGENDTFYIIRVNSITPAAPPPFEEITEEVRQRWYIGEQLRLAGIYADQALTEAEDGAPLEEIAKRYGGISFETSDYRRDRVFTQRELAPGIARLMFGLPLGGVGIEQDARGDGYVLIKVVDISSGNPKDDQFEYQALVDKLRGEIETDIFIQLQTAIQQDMDIDVNRALVNSLYNRDRPSTVSPF